MPEIVKIQFWRCVVFVITFGHLLLFVIINTQNIKTCVYVTEMVVQEHCKGTVFHSIYFNTHYMF